MNDPPDVTLSEFVAALGSAQPTPGSGSAAALSIALAAGCLGKAIAITLKHRPDAPLRPLADEAAAIAGAALAGAGEEAERFRTLLAARSPRAVGDSLQVGEGLRICAAAVVDLARRLEPEVARTVAADLTAAQALAAAAETILAANQAETLRTGL